MWIHRSNRVECLVDALSEVLQTRHGDPLAPETIVVQSQGMARYLSMRLAERFSVWANGRFPFPRVMLEEALVAVAGEPSGLLTRDALSLAIATQLQARLDEPLFVPLQRYLEGDESGDKLVQLCARLAELFDDYVVFRDDVVRGWQGGADPDNWQAALFRGLEGAYGSFHMADRAQAFLTALDAGHGPIDGFCPRLCVFGISSLPPLYVRMLAALSQRIPVHLFLLSPTREYWADLRSLREQARLPTRAAPEDQHYDEGHPLLASLGRLGREFVAAVDAEEAHHHGEDDRYVDPGRDCLLHALQADMLSLRADREAPVVASDDLSIQVHIAHGATREVEVLHDQLMGLLQRDASLRPEDMVVMAPDIDAYAPAIEAVFGRPTVGGDGRPSLPFRIADRGLLSSRPIVEAVYQLLDVLTGRFEAPAVLDALALPAVARRFAIEGAELDTLRRWVRESGIRWGVDADHRAEYDQPALAGNTFRAGLERLMLGYAMEGGGERMFAGRLPYDDIEGAPAELLGRFSAYCEQLFALRQAWAGEHPVALWQGRFVELFDALLAPDDAGQQDVETLRAALDKLVADAQAVGFDRAIGLQAMRRLLAGRLDQSRGALGFLSGGVTFCQLQPMRSLPFAVVALLGLADGAFPRQDQPLGFDLRADNRRIADRSVRDEDRYLFLEAILSARTALLLLYTGRGIHDNGVRPPSVLVAELLDALDDDFHFEAGDARAQLCTEHRLHPFSPDYFEAGPLRSYALHNYEAACALRERPDAPPRFCSRRLPAAQEMLSLSSALRYLEHPVRTFLQERLDVYVGRDLEPLSDREPLALDPLSKWHVGTQLLEAVAKDAEAMDAAPRERLAALRAPILASGDLPLGNPGDVSFSALIPEVAELTDRLRPHMLGGLRPPHAFSEALGDGVIVAGELEGIGADAIVGYQFSRKGRRGELSLWLQHVIANLIAARHSDVVLPRRSVLVCRGDKGSASVEVSFKPLQEPEAVAATVARLLLLAQRTPLPFVRDVSRAYASARGRGGGHDEALAAARAAFEGEPSPLDAYVGIAFPDFEALVADDCDGIDFATAAMAVYEPLFAHRSEGEEE